MKYWYTVRRRRSRHKDVPVCVTFRHGREKLLAYWLHPADLAAEIYHDTHRIRITLQGGKVDVWWRMGDRQIAGIDPLQINSPKEKV